VLRTEGVRDAGGFADADIGEDWRLAARLVRRGRLICLSQPVRIYHRHASAARMTAASHSTSAVRTTVRTDCLGDPAATLTQRLAARLLDS
jgi:hypothetical protein